MSMFPSLTFALRLHVSVAQAESSAALYVIENAESDRGIETQNLVRLSMDHEDKLVRETYSCGDEDFLIDVPNRVASPLKSYTLEHDFEASVAVDKEHRRSVFCKGNAIGQWVFNDRKAVTAPGLIACPYVRPSEDANLGNPDGIAVLEYTSW
jgi:hypothetical protein